MSEDSCGETCKRANLCYACSKELGGWQGLTKLHAKLLAENSPNIEWAVMMTEQALKEKNGG